VLVGARRIELLTSSTSTQHASHPPPRESPFPTASSQGRTLTRRSVLVRCGAARGVAADRVLTLAGPRLGARSPSTTKRGMRWSGVMRCMPPAGVEEFARDAEARVRPSIAPGLAYPYRPRYSGAGRNEPLSAGGLPLQPVGPASRRPYARTPRPAEGLQRTHCPQRRRPQCAARGRGRTHPPAGPRDGSGNPALTGIAWMVLCLNATSIATVGSCSGWCSSSRGIMASGVPARARTTRPVTTGTRSCARSRQSEPSRTGQVRSLPVVGMRGWSATCATPDPSRLPRPASPERGLLRVHQWRSPYDPTGNTCSEGHGHAARLRTISNQAHRRRARGVPARP
jgi:hypothetical protein